MVFSDQLFIFYTLELVYEYIFWESQFTKMQEASPVASCRMQELLQLV